MEKELLDKNVEILVSFARGVNDTGAVPMIYRGKLLEFDENYYKIHVWDSELAFHTLLGTSLSKSNGKIMFRKEYVIYIKEI